MTTTRGVADDDRRLGLAGFKLRSSQRLVTSSATLVELATGDWDLETPIVGRVPSPGGLEGSAVWGHAASNLES